MAMYQKEMKVYIEKGGDRFILIPIKLILQLDQRGIYVITGFISDNVR